MKKPTPLHWSINWEHLTPMQRVLMWTPIIGPQGRIYTDLLRQLKQRAPDDLAAWDLYTRDERVLALAVCDILGETLGWPVAVFLPEDPADIPFWDHTGDMADVEAVLAVEEILGTTVPSEFWEGLRKTTFGAVIRELSRMKTESSGQPLAGSLEGPAVDAEA